MSDKKAAQGGSKIKQNTYNRIARLYDIFDLPFEHVRYKPLRRVLFDGLSGALLDAGVGTGRNFPFYLDGCKVTGIDFSPAMLDRARYYGDSYRNYSVGLKGGAPGFGNCLRNSGPWRGKT
ncbi:MAG: methyltransferase domain-containing protein [Rhodospirillales bacterium]|nr:methyltransferase domain-containing protein [Rhodospirillales bacterium]